MKRAVGRSENLVFFGHLKGANIYDSGPPDGMRTEKNAESQLISDQNSNHTNLPKGQFQLN